MELQRPAKAGTTGSNDIQIELSPCEDGIQIQLESVMKYLYEDSIRQTICEMLQQFGVERALVKVRDLGALDYTIRARMETVIKRAASVIKCEEAK